MARMQQTAVALDGAALAAAAESRPAPQAVAAALPDQRQGWLVVLGLAVVLCVIFGTTISALGLFALPITADLQCSHEQAARFATAFMLSMTLSMPLAGWLLDRLAPRPVMTAGSVLAALGYLLAASSPDIDRLTLAMALGGIGVGASTYVPAMTLASRWMAPARQGLAFGILLAGAAIGGVIFPNLLTRLIGELGWRSVMQLIAGLILLVCVPLLLWLARLPEAPTTASRHAAEALPGHDIGQVLRMPRYWLWIAMQLLLTMSGLGIYISLVSCLVSAGYSAQAASTWYAGVGAASLAGNFLFGALSQRCSARTILLCGNAIGIAGLLCLLLAQHPAWGLAAVAVFTLSWGTTFNLVNQLAPLLLVEAMGPRNFGSLLGIGNLLGGLGAAFGPAAVGYLVDTSGSYAPALLLCTALAAAATLPIALQQRPQAPDDAPLSAAGRSS
ncbi:Predicted arabinose efflux permease, MFS family [Pseudomonas linyingensis]|uniref:Predicted arabinose efflux permease, MFS family n=1 Tax=Pseudomonas linyingensis TaxID=915471 RepID=A0A1H6ZXR1_9PSED|nr:MFS transporter [Pseudomonas linyingensis]SEJ54522.1 Predicted arabinose efflux permease, MFS family [Pseudomonas linyingensis]